MTITDEMVEKAQRAYYGIGYDHSGNENHLVQGTYSPSISMRAALEAVAPTLFQQAAGYIAAKTPPNEWTPEVAAACRLLIARALIDMILARAQELDPQ